MSRIYDKLDYTKPLAYITGEGNYTNLFYRDKTTLTTSFVMQKIINKYPELVRISKHVAVNPRNTLWRFNKSTTSYVIIWVSTKRVRFPIARRRYSELKQQFYNGRN